MGILSPVGLFRGQKKFLFSTPTVADEVLYAYEGDVLHYDGAGWDVFNPCENGCSEEIVDGKLVRTWEGADLVNYHYWMAQPPDEPPPKTEKKPKRETA